MPEISECRIFAEALAKDISGMSLQAVTVGSGRYTKKEMTGLSEIDFPMKVVGVGVHGKFIYWILENENFLWSTVGMTGQWSTEKTTHTRVSFGFSNKTVYFNDQRNFGTLKFVRGKFQMIEKLKSLGPDVLQDSTTFEVFLERIRKKDSWEITKALLDQSVIAGVGNYVKADSLWLARIAPTRIVKSLSDAELKTLLESIKKVAQRSYELGGASFKTYAGYDNVKSGNYAKEFLVYSRKKDNLGNPVERLKTKDGRTTHWAPAVQE